MIVRGTFNPDQLQSVAREHGGVFETYRTKQLVTSPDVIPHAIAFLEPGLVAVGPTEAVKKAIDAQMGPLAATGATGVPQSITGNDEMMNLVRDIAATNNAWAVGRFDLIASQAQLP